jgi:predicted nucleic acid-binding protein
MLAVCNTSPISNLASIGRLDLLPAQFAQVWIPRAVANELSAHPDSAAKVLIQSALNAGWLQIQSVEESASLKMLRAQLHIGEAEAIALALSNKAGKVLIDEKEGRRIAIQCGISVTGVLGILLRAKLMGQIEYIQPEIEKLRSVAGFYIAPSLSAKVLRMSGAR